MVKYLLIGASALAFATAAHADPKTVDLSNNHGSAINVSGFNTAINNAQQDRAGVYGQDESAARNAVSTYDASGTVNIINDRLIAAGVGSDVALSAAGNKSTIDQDGALNDANVNQAGGDQGWSVVDQSGANNKATVTQTDGSNGPVVFGSNVGTSGAGTTKNAAYISQLSSISNSNANTNNATIEQNHRRVTVLGGGVGEDGRNTAAIMQGSMVPNVASGGAGFADNATVKQNGAGNEALIEQGVIPTGQLSAQGRNFAKVTQGNGNEIGLRNNAVVQQKSDGYAVTDQFGSDNEAYVLQVAEADSTIYQNGSENFAAVTQSGVGAISNVKQYGYNNSAFVNQSGANTLSEIKQGSELATSNYEYASVVQSAKDASSHVTQSSGASLLGFGILGGNEAYVTQAAAAGSTSIITQTGYANQAVVSQ